MSDQRSVLVLDAGSESPDEILSRLGHLGFSTRLASTVGEVRVILENASERIGALLLMPVAPSPELVDLLSTLPLLSGEHVLGVIAVGTPPNDEVRGRLHEAGVRRALWEPYDDGSLRFVMNEEMTPPEELAARGEIRVPTTLFAKVRVGQRVKDALVYNISASGAYLETPRPSVRGARLLIQIPLPDCGLEAEGIVVYTNVPGNLYSPLLPLGMAARFTSIEPSDAADLRAYVEERSRRFQL